MGNPYAEYITNTRQCYDCRFVLFLDSLSCSLYEDACSTGPVFLQLPPRKILIKSITHSWRKYKIIHAALSMLMFGKSNTQKVN